jgi:hypothetical protein
MSGPSPGTRIWLVAGVMLLEGIDWRIPKRTAPVMAA